MRGTIRGQARSLRRVYGRPVLAKVERRKARVRMVVSRSVKDICGGGRVVGLRIIWKRVLVSREIARFFGDVDGVNGGAGDDGGVSEADGVG